MPLPPKAGLGGRPSSWLTDETFDEVCRLWNVDKLTSKAIADRYGVTKGAILALAHRYPDYFEQRGPGFRTATVVPTHPEVASLLESDDAIAIISAGWEAGDTQEEIAKRVGVHRKTIIKKTKEMLDAGQLKPRVRPRRYPAARRPRRQIRSPANLIILTEGYKGGKRIKDIAVEIGCGVMTVANWVDELILAGTLVKRDPLPTNIVGRRTGFFKSQELYDQLRKLWNETDMSAKDISLSFGADCTRNMVLAVVGRAKVNDPGAFRERAAVGGRRGLRSKEATERVKRKRAESRPPKEKAAPREKKPKPYGPPKRPRFQRGLQAPPAAAPAGYRGPRCKYPLWPNGARPTHVYCDAPAEPESSWCAYHRAICCREEAA